MPRSSRAAIYARYLSDLSRDASIEDQVRLCRQHAERAGWAVAEVFEDRAISGASAIRPGYQAFLAAVVDGGVDIVFAEALDRLSRDQEDIAPSSSDNGFSGCGSSRSARARSATCTSGSRAR
jgi:site-specific DNA recombinase